MVAFTRALLNWFVDDEDVFWSPWRAVLLWVLVVGLLVLVGWAATSAGWNDQTSDGNCSPAMADTGGC